MNSTEDQLVHKCRLCLDSEGSPTSTMDDKAFRAKLDAVCNFSFSSLDQLPSNVCRQCSSKITEFHDFIQTVRSNQEKLLSMVPNAPIKLETSLKNEIFLEPTTYEIEIQPTVKQEVFFEDEQIDETPVADELREDEDSNDSDSLQNDPEASDDDRLIKQYFNLDCELCSIAFGTYKQLSQHSKKVHKRKPSFQCCNKTIQTRHQMLHHIKTHLRPFKCNICEKTFPYQQSLTLHAATHLTDEDKPFKCDKCPRSFEKEHILRVHVKIHDPADCSICHKTFSSVYSLKNHIQTLHNGEKFICDVCGKEFKCRAQVKVHRLVHTVPTREDGVRCEICHTWISRKRYLRRHMAEIHESKETECDICHKMYPNLKAMRKHKGIVHVESKFECEVCGKRFKRPQYLTEHRAVHTGEKLYSCEFCGVKMNSTGNLSNHKKNKHSVEWKEQKAARLTDERLNLNINT